MIPNIRIRRRKPRQSEKRHEHSPKHSKTTYNSCLQGDATGTSTDTTNPKANNSMVAPQASSLSEDIQVQLIPELSGRACQQPHDETIVVEDIEDEELQHEEHSSEQLLPAQLVQVDTDANADQANVDDGIADSISTREEFHDNVSSKPTVENLGQDELTEQSQLVSAKSSNPEIAPGFEEVSTAELQQPEESTRTPDQEHASIESGSTFRDTFSAEGKNEMNESVTQQVQYERVLSDMKPIIPVQARHAPTKEDPITNPATGAVILSTPLFPIENHQDSTIDSSAFGMTKATSTADNTTSGLSESTTQRANRLPENDLPRYDQTTSSTFSHPAHSTEVLQSKLLDMETILRTSSAALSATKLSNEFERAVLQLHQQILDMVEECLILAGARSGETADSLATKASANAEFLDFLEAQARTQGKNSGGRSACWSGVTSLAQNTHRVCSDMLRILQLEEEITALRIGRTETERLCTELRTDLRKCRSELACHIANATDIQRQKSALEEKLETSDNQLHVKGIALAKLQAEYDKMHRVAAEAQMRVEKFKRGEFDESMDNQIEHKLALLPASNYEKRVTRTRLSTNKEIPEDPNPPTKPRVLDTSTISSRPSNVAALEAMKQQMTQDIQDQIASTKYAALDVASGRAALREMEVCSASGKTLEEEEEELRQLQQQLTARSSEMAAAMNESRHKLQELLDPTAASSFSGADQDSMAPNQEPTIFDSTALVNELIARAENAPPYNATRCAKAPIADSSDTQSLIVGVGCGQQFIEFHRPTRDAQSFLYKKWTSDRSRKIAQLATYRDQQAVIQAQQSMQAFQQTLAEFRNQR
ncbi:hypothetical protein ON010_g14728 [Phytophthora cinnamomi]|nr:hypothetical protein ON010_g14728 [Phytophthora cinnamomi]